MAVQTREIQACDGLSEVNEFSIAVELSHKRSTCETAMCKPKRTISKRKTKSQKIAVESFNFPNNNLLNETVC